MKRVIIILVMLFVASGICAQRFSPEKIALWRTDVLSEKLVLTDFQKEEVYYIYLQYAQQKENKKKQNADSDENRAMYRKGRKELDTAIKSVLTEEQRNKYIEIQRNRKNTVKVQILLQEADSCQQNRGEN